MQLKNTIFFRISLTTGYPNNILQFKMATALRRLRYAGVLLKYFETLNTYQICTIPKRRVFSSCRTRYSVGKVLASNYANRGHAFETHSSGCISDNRFEKENRICTR